jgi:DNA-binding NarL/FixJ family response regulator
MKVLIVEDHPIVVSGCRHLFATQADIFLAPTLAEARKALNKYLPDVTVVDINLPDGSGLEFVRELIERDATTKVVVFSMADDPLLAMTAIDFGAKGFVSKNDDPRALLSAVEAVGSGEIWLSDNFFKKSQSRARYLRGHRS